MAHPRKLFGLILTAALLTGCGSRQATTAQSTGPQPRSTSADQTDRQSPPTANDEKGNGATAPEGPAAFRAERETVSVRPRGETRVRLLNAPARAELVVTVEPPDSQLTAVVEGDVLMIRAGDKAARESVVTVKGGTETTRVRVEVGPEKG